MTEETALPPADEGRRLSEGLGPMPTIDWHAHGMDWALADAHDQNGGKDWTAGCIARAFAAGAAAATKVERERCYDIVMRAPYEEDGCEDDGPEVDDALKAMAFMITAQIRGYVKPEKAGTQQVLDLGTNDKLRG